MTQPQLDRLDRLILNTIQGGFPVDARPYRVLAERLSAEHSLELSEDEVLTRVSAMKRNGFIRRLGAIFNAAPLGYRSTLCAARVPEDKLMLFSGLVNQAPQVTHNYLRSDDLNIWFTFTSDQPLELTNFLNWLKTESGVEEIHVLEAEKLFKIKVDFKFSD
jgi:Transcriptional regulators